MMKMLVIGFLIVLLLIPLAMVGSLVMERKSRSGEAAEEVASTWGRSQVLAGPVLTVPYLQHVKNEKGVAVTLTSYARFLPETLDVGGDVKTEKRSRGIFEVAVYRTDLRWKGAFARPDFGVWRIAPEDVLWQDAYLAVGVPDMRGITSGVNLQWGNRTLQLAPGGGEEGLWSSGLRVPVPGLAESKPGEVYAFVFDLSLNGSRSLSFLPFGQETRVALQSPWPSPSFTGSFLPVQRTVGGTGFEALWNVSWFGRSYPQQWRADEAAEVASAEAINNSAFGVQLFVPVDAYQKTERARKYGVLFLLLTFLTFFLYEQFNPFSLHPVQYLLVGSALCLFYLLLLSISEHVPFGLSYLVASAATVLLIGGYSIAILRGALRALLMTVVLGALYGYLYVLLQLEDYALLLGSAGLFVILALVMYLTRRVNWSGNPRSPESPSYSSAP
ncbi:MAG TPA: cell envelope integrity protein CreD [Thermoanaerobaculia bacterium]|jgi:inner membrane protein|nr:cell envelope integrity protein CreD [Thermoanaerobaculia bacterium]